MTDLEVGPILSRNGNELGVVTMLDWRLLVVVAAGLFAQGSLFAQAGGRLVEVNGFDMYVEESGAGEPLILLHAFGGCGEENWGAFVADLARHYRVIVPDLRGHGRSTNPSGEFSHRQSAEDVLALAGSLGIDRFRAMGISSGGMALLHVAVNAPERIQSLVLIGTPMEFGEHSRAMIRASARSAEMHQLWRPCVSRGEEQLAELAEQFLGFADVYDDMNLTLQDLGLVTTPTLIVHGDRDMIFPVEGALAMYRGIPESTLWIVPVGQHVPIYGPVAPEFLRTALLHLRAN